MGTIGYMDPLIDAPMAVGRRALMAPAGGRWGSTYMSLWRGGLVHPRRAGDLTLTRPLPHLSSTVQLDQCRQITEPERCAHGGAYSASAASLNAYHTLGHTETDTTDGTYLDQTATIWYMNRDKSVSTVILTGLSTNNPKNGMWRTV